MFARCPTCHSSSRIALPILRVLDRQADLHRADELASLAIKIDPDYSHGSYGQRRCSSVGAGRYREAIDSYRRAEMLFPKQHSAWIAYGLHLCR